MRVRQSIDVPAYGRWPDAELGAGSSSFGPFSWMLVENRGPSDVVLATNQRVANDPHDYIRKIAAGDRRVLNFGDEHDPTEQLPTEVQFLNLAFRSTTVYFEVANHPIVDIAATSPTAMLARSISGNVDYAVSLDFARRLTVAADTPWWWLYPAGRIIYLEEFETLPLKWTSAGVGAGNAIAMDATTAHTKGNSLKLTTGNAAIGNTAVARKYFMLPADQGSQLVKPGVDRTLRIILGCYFRQADANLKYFAIRLLIDDTNIQREMWAVYYRRELGADQNFLAYLNNVGGLPSTGQVYPIDIPGSTDVWNYLTLEVDKENGTDGQGGYCWYRTARISDKVWKPAPLTIAGAQQASVGARFCQVDLIAATDVAAAAVVYVDDFILTDLSAALNQ